MAELRVLRDDGVASMAELRVLRDDGVASAELRVQLAMTAVSGDLVFVILGL